MKRFLWVFIWFIRRTKPHILMVTLMVYFTSVVAKAINEPCFIESNFVPFGESFTKLTDSGLESWKLASKIAIDVFRPIRCDRVYLGKLALNSAFKGISFSPEMPLFISVTCKSMSG